MSAPWKVTVGTLAAIAVASAGFTASLVAGGPGSFEPVMVGQPVATPSSPVTSRARADETRARPATSAKSAAEPAKQSKPKPSSPRTAAARSVSAGSADSAD